MDELIILLVRGLIRLFSGDTKKPPKLPSQWTPSLTVQQAPPQPQLKRRQGKRRPPPIPIAQPIMTVVDNSAPPLVSILGRGTATAAPTAHNAISKSATSIRKLLSPENLQHQFILTEILQRPVALRDDR